MVLITVPIFNRIKKLHCTIIETNRGVLSDESADSMENHTLQNLRVSQTGSTIDLIGSETDDPIYVNTAFVSDLEESDV